jgi:hypothetical protein
MKAGKQARRAGYTPTGERRPPGFDPNARNRRLQGWFAPHVRRELEELAARIDEVRAEDGELADVLSVGLSAILYKVSFRASDTDPSKVERNIGRGAAARLFAQRVEMLDWVANAGMNSFVYGPKDDIKIRARWRELYNAAEAAELQELVDAARARKLIFMVAIAPCLDVVYSDVEPGSPQYRWLEQDLTRTDRKWKFAYFHYPPYNASPHHGSNLRLRESLEPLFLRYRVSAVFNAS